MSAPEGITCPICNVQSKHPQDIAEGYCANCYAWTNAACDLAPALVARSTRGGRCPICNHRPEDHPHGGIVTRPTYGQINARSSET